MAKHQRSWTRDDEGGREAHNIKTGPWTGKRKEEKHNIFFFLKMDH